MCGGSIEMVPCSVTIHLYRDHKYSKETKGKGGYRWNTDRIAETWLDDNYKKYYYRSVGDTKNRNYGDISDRLALKEKIGCKNFTWFVENVYPDLGKIPEHLSDETWARKERLDI
jgi:polypeptide N-acetylgalactosaminyltransferase